MKYPSLVSRLRTASVLISILALLIVASAYGELFAWPLILAVYLFVVLSGVEVQKACLHQPLHHSTIGEFVAKSCFVMSLLLPSTVVVLLRADPDRFNMLYGESRLMPLLILANGISLFAILLPVVFQAREDITQVERKVLERMIVILLVGIGGASLVSIAAAPDSPYFFLWLVTVVAVNDSSAYFIGARIKTPPLSPVVSPKKTVLGSAAGLTGGMLAGSLLWFLLPPISNWYIFLFGLLCVNLLAQLGDLLKSLVKRLHGMKDMGTMLPGHGGVLDRIDGLLLASPFAINLLLLLTDL